MSEFQTDRGNTLGIYKNGITILVRGYPKNYYTYDKIEYCEWDNSWEELKIRKHDGYYLARYKVSHDAYLLIIKMMDAWIKGG